MPQSNWMRVEMWSFPCWCFNPIGRVELWCSPRWRSIPIGWLFFFFISFIFPAYGLPRLYIFFCYNNRNPYYLVRFVQKSVRDYQNLLAGPWTRMTRTACDYCSAHVDIIRPFSINEVHAYACSHVLDFSFLFFFFLLKTLEQRALLLPLREKL
jgi:hypothetical protein